MNNCRTDRRVHRVAHVGYAVGIHGELTDGMRRRIMAVLRMSSLFVAFGRRTSLGALGAGAIAATVASMTPADAASTVTGTSATAAGLDPRPTAKARTRPARGRWPWA